MSSGINHERDLKNPVFIAPCAAIAWGISLLIQDPTPFMIGVVFGYLFGGFYASPDLDTRSRCYFRWKPFTCLVWPYQVFYAHRGISHWVIVGTLSRFLYFAAPGIALAVIDASIGWGWLWHPVSVGIFVGMELSALVHLFGDYVRVRR